VPTSPLKEIEKVQVLEVEADPLEKDLQKD
jgi:hypothetical protein